MANRNEAAWELAEQTAVAMLVGGVSTAGPDAAAIVTAAGPLLQAALSGIIGSIRGTRTKHAAETLVDAAREAGAISADAFAKFVEGAVSDERSLELLARALTVAQDAASRAKRRAAGRSIAAAVADKDEGWRPARQGSDRHRGHAGRLGRGGRQVKRLRRKPCAGRGKTVG